MLPFLQQISITCFTGSYVVVLALELLRLWGRRLPGRGLAGLVMMALGILTHVTYLTLRATMVGVGSDVGRLATWTDWSLMVALGFAIAYFVLYLRRPDTVISFFFLPAILALIALALSVRHLPAFDRGDATAFWRNIHAISMMLGAGAVLFGFLAGAMYMVQTWRLKHKRAGSALRLPTLETLQNLNRRCLVISTIAVGVGLISGIVMNLNRWDDIPWTNRGIMLSGVLFLWLATATTVEFLYAPASRGRKVAYLTLASFGFLVLAMSGVLSTPHGASAIEAEDAGVENRVEDSMPSDLTKTGHEKDVTPTGVVQRGES